MLLHFTVTPLMISLMTVESHFVSVACMLLQKMERSYLSIKRIASRKYCLIMEVVYWHIMLKNDTSSTTASSNMFHRYQLRAKGISRTLPADYCKDHFMYRVENRVWVKAPYGRCISRYQMGHVTDIVSPQTILVDEMIFAF